MKKYNIGWGLTNVCNMNCMFCYSKETRNRTNESKLQDWIKFVDENYNYIDSINYGTGENTLINEFFEFLSYTRTNYPYIKQSLTSNGYIYEKVSKNSNYYKIYKKCIDEIDVSLDFADKEKHNYFRGQNKAYDWAIKTLEMLKKDGKLATIVMVGFEDTLTEHNIDGIFEIAKKYDALVRINIYRPVSESKEINEKFKLSYKTMIAALNYINSKYKVESLSDILFGSLYTTDNIIENTGVDSIRILPNGNICPSTYLISEEYQNKYSIYDSNILSKIQFDAFENAIIPKKCGECKIMERCRGGVYDRRILWHGTLEKRDPYCPFENGEQLPNDKILIHKKNRLSVHDGYLPTMFFRN